MCAEKFGIPDEWQRPGEKTAFILGRSLRKILDAVAAGAVKVDIVVNVEMPKEGRT